MWVATIVTNDPRVGTNPERNTFYGFHPNPGYDDWYGYFYGDFRGSPGDASGWIKLLHENYPDHYHWNFTTNGWAVHGHAKEYVAYYNWTFGGQCGLGLYGRSAPPPFMADQYGYPVVDIYVDSIPPYPPQPRVSDMTTSSVAFTWDPVDDQGDGAGRDFFSSGMDHYVSWLTLNGLPSRLQLASTSGPRTLVQLNIAPRDVACVPMLSELGSSPRVCYRVPRCPRWRASTERRAGRFTIGDDAFDSEACWRHARRRSRHSRRWSWKARWRRVTFRRSSLRSRSAMSCCGRTQP